MNEVVVPEIEVVGLKSLLEENCVLLIDVRESSEYAIEHIPGSILMPLSTFDPLAVEDPQGRTVVFHCRSGGRSYEACKRWMACGRGEAYNLKGGIIAWKKKG